MSRIITSYYYGPQNINSFWNWVTEELCEGISIPSPENVFVSTKLRNSLELNSMDSDFAKKKPHACVLLCDVQVQYLVRKG